VGGFFAGCSHHNPLCLLQRHPPQRIQFNALILSAWAEQRLGYVQWHSAVVSATVGDTRCHQSTLSQKQWRTFPGQARHHFLKKGRTKVNQVQYINPAGLHAYGYSNVVVAQGAVKTIYVGGQNAVNAKGEVVGIGDIGAQSRQVLDNIEIALAAGGATLENVVKWNIYIVQGYDIMPGYQAFQERWGNRPNPPTVSMAFVAGLARPEYLIEIDAIAVVPEK
jgi:enamine deaminase RidA (YjgF/YER057c/UK114 family)